MAGQWIEAADDDSVESIAYRHGLFVDTVWQHEENAPLRESRKTPHVLGTRDRVFVPELEPKEVAAATGKTHTFRRRGVPSKIIVDLHHYGGEALAALPWKVELGERILTGTTDAKGNVNVFAMPDTGDAKLTIDPGGRNLVITLQVRRLRPIDTVIGVQQRLKNLGHYRGDVDGDYSQLTIRAVQQFQLFHALDTTGSVDDATREALTAAHGC